MDETISQRKRDHIRIVLNEDVAAKGVSTGFGRYRLPHRAVPELALREIDGSVTLFGRPLRAPLLISSMTGGAQEGRRINRVLAEAAEAMGVAMGVGSQRAALLHGDLAGTYEVRKYAPHVPLLANIGAVQLTDGFGIDACRRAVEMIEADALILHLNPLQEAVQPGGDTDFRGVLARIEQICRLLDVPVVAKEVGHGIGAEDARRLVEAGVRAIDVAGAGGTSWSEVERLRHTTSHGQRVAAAFAGWGWPTAEAVVAVRAALPDVTLIASGGIRSGVDVAKSIALGADLAGSAAPHLVAAMDAAGVDAVADELLVLIDQLRVAMFCVGARTIGDLRQTPIVRLD